MQGRNFAELSATPRTRGLHAWLAAASLAAATAIALVPSASAAAFGFDDVANLAERQAKRPYQEPAPLPADLAALTYDQLRDIRFRTDHALWRAEGLPFEAMFFHVGRGNQAVRINEIESPTAKPRHISYDPALFDYGKNTLSPEKWRDLDFAGFRVHYPLNSEAY
jgi:glucans biosynthesis protein